MSTVHIPSIEIDADVKAGSEALTAQKALCKHFKVAADDIFIGLVSGRRVARGKQVTALVTVNNKDIRCIVNIPN